MIFDWTISVGNVIATIGPILGFIIAGFLFINKMGTKVALIDQRLVSAEANLRDAATGIKQLVSDNVSIALLAEKLKYTELKIETDLTHRIKNMEQKFISLELFMEKSLAAQKSPAE